MTRFCVVRLVPVGSITTRSMAAGRPVALRRWLDGTVDRTFENPKGTAAVAIKTSADQLIWAPVMTAVFFAFLKLLEGTPDLIVPTLQTKVLPTVAANYVIWPAAHVISFKYVPSHQRVLYNNVIAIFWNAYLSIVAADSGMDANQMVDAAAAVQGAGDSLAGLGEVAGRVQDTLPFGGFWLHDMLAVRRLCKATVPCPYACL